MNLYLAGDLNQLALELKEQGPEDEALKKKIVARLIDNRNLTMAERIAALCAKKPARSYFFAVGALHYAGDTGILSQLARKGFKITRLGPSDVAFEPSPSGRGPSAAGARGEGSNGKHFVVRALTRRAFWRASLSRMERVQIPQRAT